MSYELSTLASEWMWGWGRPCWYKPLFMLKNRSEHKNIINQEPLYQNRVNPFSPHNCKMDYHFKRVIYFDFCFISFEYLCGMWWITADLNPLYTSKYLQITWKTSVTMRDCMATCSSWFGSIWIICKSLCCICGWQSTRLVSGLTRFLTAKLWVQCRDLFWWLDDWCLACTARSILSVTNL